MTSNIFVEVRKCTIPRDNGVPGIREPRVPHPLEKSYHLDKYSTFRLLPWAETTRALCKLNFELTLVKEAQLLKKLRESETRRFENEPSKSNKTLLKKKKLITIVIPLILSKYHYIMSFR